MNADLERYLSEKGWTWKLVEGGRQVRLDDGCPFCGKPKHFYFKAETGQWDCKLCGETGNVLTLKRALGDVSVEVKPARSYLYRGGFDAAPVLDGARPPAGIDRRFHERLLSDEGAEYLAWLQQVRGLSMATIKAARLGVASVRGTPYLTIPHYYGKELVNIKMRSIPPAKKDFRRWPDCPSVLFNGDSLTKLQDLPPAERFVILSEGELDALSWQQVGFHHSVAVSAGASAWKEEWLKPLEHATKIFLAYDATKDDGTMDLAGESGAAKAAKVLGQYRCHRVRLPLHDANDMLAAGCDRDVFQQALDAAEPYAGNGIKTIAEVGGDLLNRLARNDPKGNPTGWVTLDAIIGGVRDGEVTVVTGDTGSGKSTWTTGLIVSQAMQGIPSLVCPFEQLPWEVVAKIVGMEARRGIYDMTTTEVEGAIKRMGNLPLYLLDHHGKIPIGDLRDAIYCAVHSFGVKRVVLDHLHFFVDDGDNERRALKAACEAINGFTKDLDLHTVLVCHPKGLESFKGKVYKPTLNDLKGSSDIKQIADNGIRVHRERDGAIGSSSDLTEIAVLKCRSPAGSEGVTYMNFDPAGERYIDGANPPGYKPAGAKAGGGAVDHRSAAAGDYDDDREDYGGEEDWTRWDEPH